MKKFILENWFKLVFAFVAVMVGSSFFYYFVILGSQKEERIQEKAMIELVEKNKLEIQKSIDKVATKNQAILNSSLLQSCLDDASANYSANWANSCKTQEQEVSAGYSNCVDGLTSMTLTNPNLFKSIEDIKTSCKTHWTPDPSAECRLPGSIGQRWDDLFQKEKNQCFRKYPQ